MENVFLTPMFYNIFIKKALFSKEQCNKEVSVYLKSKRCWSAFYLPLLVVMTAYIECKGVCLDAALVGAPVSDAVIAMATIV